MKQIAIHFDGACHNKPKINQPMGVGVAVIIDGKLSLADSIALYYTVNFPYTGSMVEEGMTRGTSNIAEWKGCAAAMEKAQEINLRYKILRQEVIISVYSDSELITKQFNGEYLIKNGDFLKYERIAKRWAGLVGIRRINWIPREQNKDADLLSKIALKQLIDHEYYSQGLPKDYNGALKE